MNGTPGREWGQRDSAKRRDALVRQIQSWFPSPNKKDNDATNWALHPIDYIEKNWVNDDWSRGCPVSCYPTGTLYQYGHELRRPTGRIHWAGTETAIKFQGFMDGAIESGQRAAHEIIDRFNGTAPADTGGKKGNNYTFLLPFILMFSLFISSNDDSHDYQTTVSNRNRAASPHIGFG
jgi:hypothetical protein